MTNGRMVNPSRHTVVPQRDAVADHQPSYEVVNYRLSEEELAKYRAIPTDKEKKSVFIIPMRRKM